jgi:hypothetical protein
LPHLDYRFDPPTAFVAGTLAAVDPDRRAMIDLQPGTPGTVDGLPLSSVRPGPPLAYDPSRHRFHVVTRGVADDGVGGELIAVDTDAPAPRALPAPGGASDLIREVVVFPAIGRGWVRLEPRESGGTHVVPFDLDTGVHGEPLVLPVRVSYLIAAFGEDRLAVIDREASSDALMVFDAADGTELDLPAVPLDSSYFACWMPASDGP